MKKRKTWLIPVIVIAVLLLIVCSSCMVITYPNEYSVIKQFGQVVSIRDNKDGNSGLSFKLPFIQTVTKVPNTKLLYDLAISDVITKDKKTMVEDSFVLWYIDDPMAYIRTLNGSGAASESRIDVNVYNAIKNTISNTTQADVISGRDGALVASIKSNVGNSLQEYGINLTAVETKHLDLPDSNKQSVYDRMISERNQIAAGYTATGEQQAQEIRNAIAFLEEKTGEKWDWTHYFECAKRVNYATKCRMEWLEMNKTPYPQVFGSNLALYTETNSMAISSRPSSATPLPRRPA